MSINNLKVQWMPNAVWSERRICLTRIRWINGKVGSRLHGEKHMGYSSKLSISLCLVPQDLWIGAFWKCQGPFSPLTLWLCLVPCLPIRFKLIRSYGGIIP